MIDDLNYSSRRYNPLTQQYVLVSPLRKQRPWSQTLDAILEDDLPTFDPSCNLCPGVKRPNGQQNPDYQDLYVFPNDFPALAADMPDRRIETTELFQEQLETGVCEVMCYAPDHHRNLIHFSNAEITDIIEAWTERYVSLGQRQDINYVQIFESRGKEVGNSAPHPHCQIWAQKSIPSFPAQMLRSQQEYFAKHQRPMLLEYAQQELEKAKRVVFQTSSWVVVVPFWAEWPYELLVLPLEQLGSLTELSQTSKQDLAVCLSWVTRAYGALFRRPQNGAPYMMGIHQVPTDGQDYDGCQLFFKFITPMLTPDRQKYQAGYEKNAETQRDLTPEVAAVDIQGLSR